MTAVETRPQWSFPGYIAGEDVEDNWLHAVDVGATLQDPETALAALAAADAAPAHDSLSPHPWLVGRAAVIDDQHVEQAIHAAAVAAPQWAAWTPVERIELMARFETELKERSEEFVNLLVAEGHPRRVVEWELSGMVAQTSRPSREEMAARAASGWADEDSDQMVRQRPDGVVAVIPPANAAAPLAAAAVAILAAGNAVVLRAPRSGPLSTLWLMRELVAPLLEELGAPRGVLSAFVAEPERTLQQFLDSPEVDSIVLFGSESKGLWLEQECVKRGKKPLLELAGKDSILVWKDADLDHAADACLESMWASGMVCMLPNTGYVHPAVAEELTDKIVHRLRTSEAYRPGVPSSNTVLAAVARPEPYLRAVDQAVQAGAELLHGGRRLDLTGVADPNGLFCEPTLFRVQGLAATQGVDICETENFYPVFPLVVLDDGEDTKVLDSVICHMNSNRYGLRNSLWTTNTQVKGRWKRDMRNGGLLVINRQHTSMKPIVSVTGGTGVSSGAWGRDCPDFG